jgi:hypothetical protein
MLEGYVSDIRLDTPIAYLLLDDGTKDEENPYTKVNLHDGIEVKFGMETKIIVLGRTSQRDKWDPETKKTIPGVKGDVVVWAMGAMPKFMRK